MIDLFDLGAATPWLITSMVLMLLTALGMMMAGILALDLRASTLTRWKCAGIALGMCLAFLAMMFLVVTS